MAPQTTWINAARTAQCAVVACSQCTTYGPCPDLGCWLCNRCQLQQACGCEEGIARRSSNNHPTNAVADRKADEPPAAPMTRKKYKDFANHLIQVQSNESKRRKMEEQRRPASSSQPPCSIKKKTINKNEDDTERKDPDQHATSRSSASAKRTRLNPEEHAIERILSLK